MRNKFLVLLFGVAAILAQAQWETPLPLEAETRASLGFGMFMVADGSKSYLLYSRPNQARQVQELGIKTFVLEKKEFGEFALLSSDRMYFGGDIKGSDDGSQLLVADGASRFKMNEKPSEGASIYEIFLAFSTNSGKSWSTEKAIGPSGTEKDLAHVLPSIVPIEEAGQLYVFYITLYPNNDTAISCMKFTPESVIAPPKENIIFKSTEPILAYASTYTYANNSLLLHVVWVNNKSEIMYSTSSDCENWSNPIQIGKVTDRPQGAPIISLLSNTKASPSKLFLIYIGSDNKGHLKISEDSGATWSEPIQITEKQTDALSPTLCGNFIFFLTSTQGVIGFGKYDLVQKKTEDLPAPFGTTQMIAPSIQCVKANGKYYIAVMATVFREMAAYVTWMTMPETN